MKLRSLALVVGILLTSPAYADEATTVVQDLGSKRQNAYNSGDAAKIADLYLPDAILSSGVLGTLNGRAEIEKAVADQIKKNPKITVKPTAGYESGNVIWGYGDFMFPNGPSGHYGITAVSQRRGFMACRHAHF
jgi:hypothetical protein